MLVPVIVGADGSAEGRAAAERAAREAPRRGREQVPVPSIGSSFSVGCPVAVVPHI
jgi:hypothetical protein